MNADDSGLAIAQTSSGSETLAKKARKARVVSAFDTVPRRARPGNLIRDVEFEPAECGFLTDRPVHGAVHAAMGQLAYEGEEGPELAYRFERFGRKKKKNGEP